MGNVLLPGLSLTAQASQGIPTQIANSVLNPNLTLTNNQVLQQVGTGTSTTSNVLQPVTATTPTTTTTTATGTSTPTTTTTGGAGTTVTTTTGTTVTQAPAIPIYKQWWFWALIAAAACIAGYFIFKKLKK